VYHRAPFWALFCLIIYNIYVSDMPLIVNRPIVQFADDVKMFTTIASVNDYLQLQHDISLLMNGPKMVDELSSILANVTG